MKASKTLGFLYQNLNISSTFLNEEAYKSLVKSSLEYACSAWDPYSEHKIDQPEMVQHRATRFITNRQHIISSIRVSRYLCIHKAGSFIVLFVKSRQTLFPKYIWQAKMYLKNF